MKQGVLTSKLTKFIIIVGMMSACVITLIQVFQDSSDLKHTTLNRVDTAITRHTPAISESLWDVDLQQTELQLEALELHPYVSAVNLEVAYFDDIFMGDQSQANSRLKLVRELYGENQTYLGKLTVFISEKQLNEAFWKNFSAHMLNNLLVISITALILYFFLRNLVTHRLFRLVEQLRDASTKDIERAKLDIPLPDKNKTHDEIDELKVTIKKMWTMRQIAMRELRRSEERWRLALESSSDGLWDWDISTGKVFYSNNWKNMFGYAAGDIKDDITEWEKLAHPDDLPSAKNNLEMHFAGLTETYTSTHRMKCANGDYRWVLDRGRVIQWNKNNEPTRMVGTHTDIHELVEAQNKLKIAAMVYQQASEGMLVTNERAEIIDVNSAFTTITGYTVDEVIGRNPSILSSGKQSLSFYKEMWASIKQDGSWKGELENKSKEGKEYIEWLSISEIRDKQDNVTGYVGIFSDITVRREQEELIYYQANYDSLTNLINRRLFLELLNKKINLSRRERSLFWLMYLDLDYFKEVNDTLGHDYGDELLQHWTQRVRNHLRESDIFARLGGDEFAIVFCQVSDVTIIDSVANKLIEVLNQPFNIKGTEVYVSVSIGVVQYPKDGETTSNLIRAADQTLYKAKQLGRNQHAYYTPELQQVLNEKVSLSKKLRRALVDGAFEVYYQPIVRFSDNAVFKAEALLRWHDPEQGFISPGVFIPVAEETGTIESLTGFVVREVIQNQLQWQKHCSTDIQVSVNISPIGFRAIQKNTSSWFDELKKSELMTKRILFEITEGVLVDNDDSVLNLLLEFRDSGFEVAIDDFGTGYSSLSYLRRFHIDYLKIDKQFVDDITTDNSMKALCEAIIVMAHKLGLKVIAEGVETQLQADILKSLECDFYQGYLCSPAIQAKEFQQRFLQCSIDAESLSELE